jgi:DNA polymerase III delta prime subunit
MKFDSTESIWQEKYRPQCVEDMILPEDIKQKFLGYVKNGIPNIGLWSANPGLGKSSLARALIKQTKCPSLFINASMEKGIDVLRDKIQKFAASSSFDSDYKIVVMDEFDNCGKDSQSAWRGFIDEYSNNCRFIFTGNYKEKIIDPLLDRLENYDFATFKKEDLTRQILVRLADILRNENIEFNKSDLGVIFNAYYPGIRSMVQALQKFSSTGKLVLNENFLSDVNIFDEVMSLVKFSSYQDMIIAVNKINSPDSMYTYLYNNARRYFKSEAMPQAIIAIAKYQDMSSNVRNKNLNLAACLTELIPCRS